MGSYTPDCRIPLERRRAHRVSCLEYLKRGCPGAEFLGVQKRLSSTRGIRPTAGRRCRPSTALFQAGEGASKKRNDRFLCNGRTLSGRLRAPTDRVLSERFGQVAMLDASAEESPLPAGSESAIAADQIRRLREELGLLDRETTAAVLRVEPRTLDDWRQKRTGPPSVKVGGRVFYRLTSILRWIERIEEVPTDLRAGDIPPGRRRRT